MQCVQFVCMDFVKNDTIEFKEGRIIVKPEEDIDVWRRLAEVLAEYMSRIYPELVVDEEGLLGVFNISKVPPKKSNEDERYR